MSSRWPVEGGEKRGRSPDIANGYRETATRQLRDLISKPTDDYLVIERMQKLVREEGANPNIVNVFDVCSLLYIIELGSDKTSGLLHDTLLITFRFLLGRDDIDVNVVCVGEGRLIHHAVCMKDPAFLRALLENRSVAVGINFHDLAGLTPIHCACGYYDISIQGIEYLLNAGANPNIRCSIIGRTPLQILMQTYNHRGDENKLIRILEVFFQHAATRIGDPNLRDIHGETLLHYAAYCIVSRAVIDILLGKGEYRSIDVFANLHGTPMDAAIAFGNTVAMGAIRDWKFRQAG